MRKDVSCVISVWVEINKEYDIKVFKQGETTIVRDNHSIQDAVDEMEKIVELLKENGYTTKVIEKDKNEPPKA